MALAHPPAVDHHSVAHPPIGVIALLNGPCEIDTGYQWVFPDDVEVVDETTKQISTQQEVNVGPMESMSKSKKNVIDPESIIKNYGADSARWFMLSDSPPERDINWSESGIQGSWKFCQKIWTLVHSNKDIFHDNLSEEEYNLDSKKFLAQIHQQLNGITKSIEKFQMNVAVAKI